MHYVTVVKISPNNHIYFRIWVEPNENYTFTNIASVIFINELLQPLIS